MPRRSAGRLRRRSAAARLRVKVGHPDDSTGSATIHSHIIVMATVSRGVKPYSGQPQGVIRDSLHAPGSTVAHPRHQSPLPRDKPAAQAPAIGASGTQRRRRCAQETPRDGIGQENTPVAPKACINSACERAGMYGARAHRKLASAQLTRSSNAQHRTDFKSKRAQDCLCLCCPRCFCFRRPCAGTLCLPSRWATAQVPPLLAPLSPPASSSSTHTHNTQVPLSSI